MSREVKLKKSGMAVQESAKGLPLVKKNMPPVTTKGDSKQKFLFPPEMMTDQS
jgi:hypothetical protein